MNEADFVLLLLAIAAVGLSLCTVWAVKLYELNARLTPLSTIAYDFDILDVSVKQMADTWTVTELSSILASVEAYEIFNERLTRAIALRRVHDSIDNKLNL